MCGQGVEPGQWFPPHWFPCPPRHKVIGGKKCFEAIVDGEPRWYPCEPTDSRGWSWWAALSLDYEKTLNGMTPRELAERLRDLPYVRLDGNGQNAVKGGDTP